MTSPVPARPTAPSPAAPASAAPVTSARLFDAARAVIPGGVPTGDLLPRPAGEELTILPCSEYLNVNNAVRHKQGEIVLRPHTQNIIPNVVVSRRRKELGHYCLHAN